MLDQPQGMQSPDVAAGSLRNILVATDFSGPSARALSYAIALARRLQGHIFLTHILGTDRVEGAAAAPDQREKGRSSAEQAISALLASRQLAGVPHDVLLEEGYLWHTLEQIIRDRAIDLVVVGTRGVSQTQQEGMGSVAEMILRRAECPVLTVGPAAGNAQPKDPGFKSILFATDFGRATHRAGPYAFSLARQFQANLAVLNVVADSKDYPQGGEATVREVAGVSLVESLPEDLRETCRVKLMVEFGDATQQILKAARENHADLIVMGARAGRTIVTHLPHTTVYTVAMSAPCPLLTVKG